MLNDKQVVAKFKGITPFATWKEMERGWYKIGVLIDLERIKHGQMIACTPEMDALWDRCRLTGAIFRLKEDNNG